MGIFSMRCFFLVVENTMTFYGGVRLINGLRPGPLTMKKKALKKCVRMLKGRIDNALSLYQAC